MFSFKLRVQSAFTSENRDNGHFLTKYYSVFKLMSSLLIFVNLNIRLVFYQMHKNQKQTKK